MNPKTEMQMNEENEIITLASDSDGTRLDAFISDKTDMTRSQAVRLIEGGFVRVGGQLQKKNYKLKIGDEIEIELPENEECEAAAEDIPLDIRYEDDDIIVVNKPVGMVVHPAPGHSHGTLVNALMYHCGSSLSGVGGVSRPGIVHRIDRDTTGLICAAKNDMAHLSLAHQLQDHSMHREYRLIALGGFPEDFGIIDAPIGRHPTDRKKMAVLRGGQGRAREAVTNWRVLERFSGYTYLEAVLETGRTHQIRVHFSYIGHPLMGDETYGGGHTQFERKNQGLIDGQMLHAHALILCHPRTGESMRFESALPENFDKMLENLRR